MRGATLPLSNTLSWCGLWLKKKHNNFFFTVPPYLEAISSIRNARMRNAMVTWGLLGIVVGNLYGKTQYIFSVVSRSAVPWPSANFRMLHIVINLWTTVLIRSAEKLF